MEPSGTRPRPDYTPAKPTGAPPPVPSKASKPTGAGSSSGSFEERMKVFEPRAPAGPATPSPKPGHHPTGKALPSEAPPEPLQKMSASPTAPPTPLQPQKQVVETGRAAKPIASASTITPKPVSDQELSDAEKYEKSLYKYDLTLTRDPSNPNNFIMMETTDKVKFERGKGIAPVKPRITNLSADQVRESARKEREERKAPPTQTGQKHAEEMNIKAQNAKDLDVIIPRLNEALPGIQCAWANASSHDYSKGMWVESSELDKAQAFDVQKKLEQKFGAGVIVMTFRGSKYRVFVPWKSITQPTAVKPGPSRFTDEELLKLAQARARTMDNSDFGSLTWSNASFSGAELKALADGCFEMQTMGADGGRALFYLTKEQLAKMAEYPANTDKIYYALDRNGAEKLLQGKPPGTFYLRGSSLGPHSISASVIGKNGAIEHFAFKYESDGFISYVTNDNGELVADRSKTYKNIDEIAKSITLLL